MKKTALIIDPITFEVVKGRLWSITNEQGLVAATISGSQLIQECFDLNTGVMNKDGDGIFFGYYNTMVGSTMESGVKWIIEHEDEMGGFRDGDVFIYNDPWIGCVHLQDVQVAAPVFYEGKLICWQALAMHETDVGGPIPGSFGLGFSETFADGTLMTPIKLVDGGRYNKSIEMLYLRNTRTVLLNQLNLRARMGALNFARQRITETCKEYGRDIVTAVLEQTREYARGLLQARLRELPDGTWSECFYMDHDGTSNQLYKAKLAMTKKGDRLTFDFTGTAGQAPGIMNCTKTTLYGAILCGSMPLLCFDTPRSSAAVRDIIDVVINDGTIFSAQYPASASGGPIQAGNLAADLVYSCIAKMLACSDKYRDETEACWHGVFQAMGMAGLNRQGVPMLFSPLDAMAGGAGATRDKDGIDCAGMMIVMYMVIGNVESNEYLFPVLQPFRRIAPESCGHGKRRGGAGIMTSFIPHKNMFPHQLFLIGGGCAGPSMASGLMGGYMPSISLVRIARNANIKEKFDSMQAICDISELKNDGLEIKEGKFMTLISGSDLLVVIESGGGGYGDPLERDTGLIKKDVKEGIYSIETARRVYGCVLDPKTLDIDLKATQRERGNVIKNRLRESRLVEEIKT
jgi:N-methylhydantoinase B/oxoprolinase/acetone carboxylase alpha subunit